MECEFIWMTLESIVGVNKYRPEKQEYVDVLTIDNTMVRESQIARLKHIRATRDNAKVEKSRINS